jgi:DNA-binding response OmpR family regulator
MALVLIVEDTESVAPLEIALAAVDGIQVLTFSDSREAMKLLNAGRMELAAVITDLHLPFVDGFEILRTIRAHNRYSRLPVIVVSGDNDPEIRRHVAELGANAFFEKPYSPAQIRHKLEGLIYAS